MTTKEALIDATLNQPNHQERNISLDKLIAFINIILECHELDKIDIFVKAKGYDDIVDFDYEWCEGHFDDGLYDDAIYESEETFKEHIIGYTNVENIFQDIPHKSKR